MLKPNHERGTLARTFFGARCDTTNVSVLFFSDDNVKLREYVRDTTR